MVSEDKSMTIKQLADELGVTKTAVRNKLTDNFREKFVKKVDGTIYIDQEGVTELRQHFFNSSHVTSKATKASYHQQKRQNNQLTDSLLATLQEQLAEKDAEIARLHQLLNQQQQITARLQDQKAKKSWWKRLIE